MAEGTSSGTGTATAEHVARPWKVLAVTSVAAFMALLDVTIVNVDVAVLVAVLGMAQPQIR